MITTYHFRVGWVHYIINDETSSIGYSYPRVFLGFPNDEYLNLDLTLGAIFKMSEFDFWSWIDGSEIELDSEEAIREVCGSLNLSWDALFEVGGELLKDRMPAKA